MQGWAALQKQYLYACPDVCKFSPLDMAISGPSRAMLFIISTTLVSFPGMTCMCACCQSA